MNPFVAALIGAVVGIAVGALLGFFYRKKVGEAKIGSAELEAKRIREEAEKNAENLKKEAELGAKE